MDLSDQDTKTCKNCKRDVLAANFMTHEMHCVRNISLCQYCDVPFPKSELEEHVKDTHKRIQCDKCNESMETQHLRSHQKASCGKRLVKCPYCEIETAAVDLAEHEDYCGSRTERCEGCGSYVMLKNQIVHEASNHKLGSPESSAHVRNNSQTPASASFPVGIRFPEDDYSNISLLGSLRPSAGKRTNDMPQVNRHSQRDADSFKGVHKPVIDPRRVVSSLSQEDMDELLAMHMLQDDVLSDTTAINVSQLEKGYGDATGPGLFATPRTDYRPPPPPPENPLPECDDLVILPCEFCNEPFAAEDIEDHQSQCRLDFPEDVLGGNLLRRDFEPPIETDLRLTNNLYQPGDTEKDVIEIPCEYCDQLFPVDDIIQHQSGCEFIPRVESRGRSPEPEPVLRPVKRQPDPDLFLDVTRNHPVARPGARVREVPIKVDHRHPSVAKNKVTSPKTSASAGQNTSPLPTGTRPKGADGKKPVAAPRRSRQTSTSIVQDEDGPIEIGEKQSRKNNSAKPVQYAETEQRSRR